MRILMATGDAVAIAGQADGRWRVATALVGRPTHCLAADPSRPELVYCGTFGDGLWRSRDAGDTWEPVGPGITHPEVMAVAVSPLERAGAWGVVWAGTEPSAIFRSEDGGQTWVERPRLKELPSAPTWSFPPRPWTHHVRWIAPDPVVAERLFVGIELGGVMRSLDGGLTWEDRKPNSQHDAHTLRTHRLSPRRVYEAAGGGYAESRDGGETWQRPEAGLRHHYVWGLAVDPGDPETILISATPGPMQAHNRRYGDAHLYRRTAGRDWQEVQDGLPDARGVRAYILAAHDAESGVFYAASEGEVYRSADAGRSWEALGLVWPEGYQPPATNALALVEAG